MTLPPAPAAFSKPVIQEREFDPAKAAQWSETWGIPFPYEEGTDVFVAFQDWVVEFELDGELYRMTVPRGWVTDGASVPALLWGPPLFMHPARLGFAAVFAHDALYHRDGAWPWLEVWRDGHWVASARVFTKGEVDRILRGIMARDGKGRALRGTAWFGVRLNLIRQWRWGRRR